MSEPEIAIQTPLAAEQENKPLRPGLGVKFKVGEQLPWKGLWFEVASVGYDVLTLKPVGMTWQRYKQIQKEKQT